MVLPLHIFTEATPPNKKSNRYPVRSVFCHLEAGRCGVKAGIVAVEADGGIVWAGKELTEDSAAALADWLPQFVAKKKAEYGMA